MNILGPDQMKSLGTAISSADFTSLYDKKNAIEYFMGLNLTETVGLSLSPRLIIPILSGGTTWLSSWLMSRKNKPTDPAMVTQQRIMSITIPPGRLVVIQAIIRGKSSRWYWCILDYI